MPLRILLVSATAPESDGLASLRGRITHELQVLVTGVGMVATAAHVSRVLAASRFDVALNVGLCGTFDPSLPLGSVVHVVSDQVAELGAEDGERFLTLDDLDLSGSDGSPSPGGPLLNPAPPASATLIALPQVSGITVNTVHGREDSIARVVGRLRPQVESMEGAAFMYACLVAGVPFAQLRAVSNRVERRNRAAWRVADALASLTRTAGSIVETL